MIATNYDSLNKSLVNRLLLYSVPTKTVCNINSQHGTLITAFQTV